MGSLTAQTLDRGHRRHCCRPLVSCSSVPCGPPSGPDCARVDLDLRTIVDPGENTPASWRVEVSMVTDFFQ